MSQQNVFQFQPQQKKSASRPLPQHTSVIESLRDVGSQVGNTVKNDVVGGVASSAFQSLLGNFPKPMPPEGGNPENPFPFPLKRPERHPMSATPRPEILSPDRIQAEQAKTQQQIEDVRRELLGLVKAVGNLNIEVEKAIAEVPVNPGVYHQNFFERLKSVIKMIRQSVEDSRTWASLSTGRKKQKHYWGLYKKHGTQFGLSSERTVSTQTG
jgi:hypothetical protein